MTKQLEDYSKEDFIKIFAHLYRGLTAYDIESCELDKNIEDTIFHVGELCEDYCINNDWNVPNKYLES